LIIWDVSEENESLNPQLLDQQFVIVFICLLRAYSEDVFFAVVLYVIIQQLMQQPLLFAILLNSIEVLVIQKQEQNVLVIYFVAVFIHELFYFIVFLESAFLQFLLVSEEVELQELLVNVLADNFSALVGAAASYARKFFWVLASDVFDHVL
jgi:hypothetical protein